MDIESIKQKIKEIVKKYDLKLVLIFGSQVSKKTHQESDADIGFIPAKKLTLKEEYLLNYEFCNIFQTDRVDTVDLKKASPLLMKEIIDNCQILYEAEPLVFDYFEAYMRQRYQETKPLFEMHRRAVRRFAGLPL